MASRSRLPSGAPLGAPPAVMPVEQPGLGAGAYGRGYLDLAKGEVKAEQQRLQNAEDKFGHVPPEPAEPEGR